MSGNKRETIRSLHVSTKDYGACCQCCYAGLPQDPCLNCRYRDGSIDSGSCAASGSDRTLDCLWLWNGLQLHSSPRDMWFTWCTKILGTSCVSCLHWLWYCVTCCSSWKEDCMESLEPDTWWIHYNLLWAAQCTWTNSWRDRSLSEYFTILLYDMTATGSSINESERTCSFPKDVRCQVFTQRLLYSNIMKRAVLQGGHYWAAPRCHMVVALTWWVRNKTVEASFVKLAWSSTTCPELLKCTYSHIAKMQSLLQMQSWLWQCPRLW